MRDRGGNYAVSLRNTSMKVLTEVLCVPARQWGPENPWGGAGEGNSSPEPEIPEASVSRAPQPSREIRSHFGFKYHIK